MRFVKYNELDTKQKKLVDSDKVWIRHRCAERELGLDKLVFDENFNIREIVVNHGYGLDLLSNDVDSRIRHLVWSLLNNSDYKNLEQWIENNTDKCVIYGDEITVKAKNKFILYCKDKLVNTEFYHWINEDEIKTKSPIIMRLSELRIFGSTLILNDYRVCEDGLVFIPESIIKENPNREPLNTQMITPDYLASCLDFEYISRDFFYEILENWDELQMNELVLPEEFEEEKFEEETNEQLEL